jgi:ligand-binding sensor domain-containing protein/signal transduction histidine kinase
LPARIHRLLGVILLAVLAGRCLAVQRDVLPDFLLTSWDSEDGLPVASIHDIVRTQEGYLWIATSAGLARFDGVRFVVFTTNNTPALGDNRTACLTVDSAGDLWVGTAVGTLARRHGGGFIPVEVNPEIRGKPLNSIAADATGTIWLATQGAGLGRLHAGVCDLFGPSNGLPGSVVSQVVVTDGGQLFALAGGRLASFDGSRWKTQVVPSAPNSTIRVLAKSMAGGLWVATTYLAPSQGCGGQVLLLKDGQWTESPPYPWPHATMSPAVGALLEDSAGAVWLGTRNAGLFYRDPGQPWQPLAAKGAAKQIVVEALAEDTNGSVWVGFFRSDQLQQIRRRPVKVISPISTPGQSRVFTVCAASDQSVWIGTSDTGVYRWQAGELAHFGAAEGLMDERIGAIFEDRRTNLWVGTWSGLFQFKDGTFDRVKGPPALSSWVHSLTEDRAGRLWAGTRDALVCLDALDNQVFGPERGVVGSYLKAIVEDRKGDLWLASANCGLFRRVGDRFERFGAGQWEGEKNIRALHADADGPLWIATWGDGLFRLKDGKFEHWSTAEGLPSKMIHAIIEDGAGNLWFSSDNGFFGCPKRNFNAFDPGRSPPLLFWRLSTEDGLDSKMGSGVGQPTVARSKDGRLWFPNQYALAVFDPATLAVVQPAKPVLIEEVLVDGRRLEAGTADGFRVKSGAARFEFHYTTPNLLNPGRLRFRYRLDGLDSDWVDAGVQRVAYYNHLPPGNYAFRVMAGGTDGLWHEIAQPLTVRVVPRLWERGWVKASAGLLVFITLALTVRQMERGKLRRRLQELEAQRALEKERRRIAQDLHDDIGAHLTRLNLDCELAGRETIPATDPRSHLAGITRKVNQLIRAMDEIVWTINPRHDSVSSLASYLQHFSSEFFESSDIRCRADVQTGLPAATLGAPARHNLLLAIKEACNNVAKHSGATEIWLTLRCCERTLAVTVEDDGRGFDPAQVGSARNGLANMQDRLKEVGGGCVVESQPGKGCRVRFLLPF